MEGGYGAEPLAVVDGGVAADGFTGGDVVGDAGLGRGDRAVAHSAVAGHADLTGEDDVAADGGGAGEAYLGAEEGVLADGGAVADLDKVVDLGSSANAGLAEGGSVDAGVGLDLDVVFEDGGAGLGDFVPSGGGLGKAEAV